jgi:putative ABC transport system permease protein
MILTYLRLAFRLLLRNPFHHALNIVGLAVGFACFFILWNYAQNLLTSDEYHVDSNRIVRLCTDWQWTDDGKDWGQQLWGASSPAAAARILEDFGEVEEIVRIQHQVHFTKETVGHGSRIILSAENSDGTAARFKEEKAAFADPNLFTFFTIPLLAGEASKVLEKSNSIVLSQTTAKRFFGESNPIGRSLVLNSSQALSVTGVFYDLPLSSHLDFDFVISNRSFKNSWDQLSNLTNCYLKLAPATDVPQLSNRINRKMPEYFGEILRALPHVRITTFLQPLREVLFSDNLSHNNFSAKSKSFLIVFSYVAIAILLMAWANYINLTLAKISARMKEVATRKISGAGRKDFSLQFLVEAAVINSIGILLALTLIQLFRKPAEILLNIRMIEITSLSFVSFTMLIAIVVLGVVGTAVYPAFISSSHNPTALFTKSRGNARGWVPFFLTITQYASAIVLIFFGIIVNQQLQFVLDKDLGFDSRNILMIDGPVLRTDHFAADLSSYLREVNKEEKVIKTSHSSGFINLSVQVPSGTYINIDGWGVNENYLTLFGIPVIAGRNFAADDRGDVIILSRYATQRLNFSNPAAALGTRLRLGISDKDWKDFEVVGITENFRFNPLYRSANTEDETGRGVGFVYGNTAFGGLSAETVIVKLEDDGDRATIEDLRDKFEKIFHGNLYNGNFIEGYISNSYIREAQLRNQLNFFTALAIVIACLGVLGMMSHKVVENTKQIGIRKVLGAGHLHIALVLLKNTFVQIVVAVGIGFPLAVYFSIRYLERFTERIEMQWWYFAVPVAILTTVMIAAISSVLWKAVFSNPVKALKYE